MQRTYQHAIHLLNSLQSNAATIAAIKASGGTMNQSALVEMREYLSRVGHQVSFPLVHQPLVERSSYFLYYQLGDQVERTKRDSYHRNKRQRVDVCVL